MMITRGSLATTARVVAGAAAVCFLVCVPRAAPLPTADAMFADVTTEVGLAFTHVNGATGRYYMPEQMGAGAALFDYDADGDLDLFLVQGGSLGPHASQSALPGNTSRLFRNDLAGTSSAERTMRFVDVTDRAGVGSRTYGMGAAVGDYDGDGDVDLFVTSLGPETLYRNNGDGTFADVTRDAGVSDDFWSTSAAFVDYDRDGHLDLFVANYVDFTFAGNRRCVDSVGAPDYCSPGLYRPAPDRLYRNLGNGRFADVSAAAGLTRADGAGLGVAVGDYDGDGWPDLYVANDAMPNQLWMNRRTGTFEDEGPLSGSALNAAGNAEGSMGIASGDFDLDGDEDLFVTNIAGETFAMYENDGRGNFDDVRIRTGLATPTAAFTGFGTDWLDYDNDGWLDLFIANGAVNTMESQRGQPMPFRMKSLLFRNTHGKRFEDASAMGGPAFAQGDIGRGAAFGDVDNDGDVDIVVTNNGGAARLLLNQVGSRQHWLQVRLAQPGGNRAGIGAWVGVERAGRSSVFRRVRTDGSYLSASDVRAHFGLGASPTIGAVTVRWPDGQTERWTDVAADRVVTLRRSSP